MAIRDDSWGFLVKFFISRNSVLVAKIVGTTCQIYQHGLDDWNTRYENISCFPACFLSGAINVDPPPSHYISKYRLMSPYYLGCWSSKKLAITIYAFKRNLNNIETYISSCYSAGNFFYFAWKYNNYSHFYSFSMGTSKLIRTKTPFLLQSWGNYFNHRACLKTAKKTAPRVNLVVGKILSPVG